MSTLRRAGPLPFAHPGRCPRCLQRVEVCICATLPRVETRTTLVVIRHLLEAHKPTNSARLAALALPRLELLEYGSPGPSEPEAIALVRAPGTWLVFPDGPEATPGGPPPERLVILDGTWPQARRMLRRLDVLRGLPRLSLPPPEARRRMRRQSSGEGMATLEAIARALELVEGPEVARPLEALYERVVEQTLALRGERRP